MKWLTIVFSLVLAAIIVAANKGSLPQFLRVFYDFRGGDKVGHFVLMGILSFLMNMAVPLGPPERRWRGPVLATCLILVAVTIEEASQAFFPSRTLSWMDLASSYAGILAFGYGAWRLRKAQSR